MAEPMQIFDDTAFYFFSFVILTIILLPITAYKIKQYYNQKCIKHYTKKKRLHPSIESIPDYLCHKQLLSDDIKPDSQLLSLYNIFFAFIWILYILLLIQLPKYNNTKIMAFNPWDILKIAKGSDLSTIKSAYRRMARIYHPDKCTLPPLSWSISKCSKYFIAVKRAYDLLRDEEAMEKWEMGTDPNEPQRIVLFYGLPTWTVSHPLQTLSIYIVVLISFVIVIYFWWNNFNQYHKSGLFIFCEFNKFFVNQNNYFVNICELKVLKRKQLRHFGDF